MNMHVTAPDALPPAEPTKKEEKRRIITLTNRAPVQILDSEWPVIAQGSWRSVREASGGGGCNDEDSIDIRVREDRFGRVIIHAKYDCTVWIEGDEHYEAVRVGRLAMAPGHGASCQDLWTNILGVGDELRERIPDAMHRHVTTAVDQVFFTLPAHSM